MSVLYFGSSTGFLKPREDFPYENIKKSSYEHRSGNASFPRYTESRKFSKKFALKILTTL